MPGTASVRISLRGYVLKIISLQLMMPRLKC